MCALLPIPIAVGQEIRDTVGVRVEGIAGCAHREVMWANIDLRTALLGTAARGNGGREMVEPGGPGGSRALVDQGCCALWEIESPERAGLGTRARGDPGRNLGSAPA